MSTKTLRVTLADIHAATGEGESSATVLARYVDTRQWGRDIHLTDGTIVVPVRRGAEVSDDPEQFDFTVYPSDDPAVREVDRGFLVEVSWKVTAPEGGTSSGVRRVLITDDMDAVVSLGLLSTPTPIPPYTGGYVLPDELAAHLADTTDVHGIPNTSVLVTTTDPRLSDSRVPLDHSHTLAETTDSATRLAMSPAERNKINSLGTAASSDATNYATAAQGLKADAALPAATAATTYETKTNVAAGLLAASVAATQAPLLTVTPLTLTTITVAVMGQDSATGLFYGNSTANGHFQTSPDLTTWTDRTYSPSTFTPGPIGYDFDATYMYVYCSTGKVWRAPKGTFNAWTEISVPARGPLTTGRPGSLCALGSGVLLYGNYTSAAGDGSHIWRSTDAGANWTEVLAYAAGKHVHAIRRNPATGVVWASVGDVGFPGAGLHKSTDAGQTWTHMSSNDYGIDMVFVPATAARPALVVLEGDGLNRPHLMAFPQDGLPGDKTCPLVWFTGAPADAASTRGTVRGIGLTAAGDLTYWVTTESGTVGTKAGLYIAQGPAFTRAVLLKDTTGAEPSGYTRAMFSGSLCQLYTQQFTVPGFGAY